MSKSRILIQLDTDPQASVLDTDRFRRDLGQVQSAYQQVQKRVLEQIAQVSV
jgi:phosphoribosylaminoimidazole-succinocarboxamide synthase